MAAWCVAYSCSNTCTTPNTSLHKFPKCVKLRRLWTQTVKRDKWEPTKNGVLCSAHFKDGFLYNLALSPLVGCKQMKHLLKPCIPPSMFAHRSTQVGALPLSVLKKHRHIEVSKHSQFCLDSECDDT